MLSSKEILDVSNDISEEQLNGWYHILAGFVGRGWLTL
jgi:hypothetical protein